MKATQRLLPEIERPLPPPAPPRPPPPAPPPDGSPIGNFISDAPAAVPRMITSASPSFGARMYANHLPSLERSALRIVFHVIRSCSVSCRPTEAGGVHFETGSARGAPYGRSACGLVATAFCALLPCALPAWPPPRWATTGSGRRASTRAART